MSESYMLVAKAAAIKGIKALVRHLTYACASMVSIHDAGD